MLSGRLLLGADLAQEGKLPFAAGPCTQGWMCKHCGGGGAAVASPLISTFALPCRAESGWEGRSPMQGVLLAVSLLQPFPISWSNRLPLVTPQPCPRRADWYRGRRPSPIPPRASPLSDGPVVGLTLGSCSHKVHGRPPPTQCGKAGLEGNQKNLHIAL